MWLLLLFGADSGELWSSRVETAAVRLRTQATLVATTAGGIAASGRIGGLAPLRSDVDELVRQADQLVRWAGEAKPPPPAP
jgi:hypothetical protein